MLGVYHSMSFGPVACWIILCDFENSPGLGREAVSNNILHFSCITITKNMYTEHMHVQTILYTG